MDARTLGRRGFWLAALGTLAALATGAGSTGSKRFLFVQANGGWDPLCVFAPKFGAPLIQMELGCQPMAIGNFSLVGSDNRPNVEAFFARFHDRILLVNGLSTRSVNHQACMAIANTGTPSGDRSDWATLLAAPAASTFLLPHLGFHASLYAGPHAGIVARGDGLLEQAVDGSVIDIAEGAASSLPAGVAPAIDRHLGERAAARASTAGAISVAYDAAAARSRAIVDARELFRFSPGSEMAVQVENAIKVLANGISRSVTISPAGFWDTHFGNDQQSILFDDLFAGLTATLDRLATTPSPAGGVLADDTVMVVLSEMGRTPAYNDFSGRDHWPFTSAMIIGPGITGGRTIGGYDDGYIGVGVDPATGELDPARNGISAEAFGATLLALGDVDSREFLPGVEPITAVLA